MKKLVFGGFIGLLLCCAGAAFADPSVSSPFSSTSSSSSTFRSSNSTFIGVLDEVVLDESADGSGYFDIEVEVPKSRRGQSLGAQEPAIKEAIRKEIAKRGGTRAIEITIQGYETSDVIIARVVGTVVK